MGVGVMPFGDHEGGNGFAVGTSRLLQLKRFVCGVVLDDIELVDLK